MKKRFLGLVILCIFVGAIIAMINLNKWIQGEVSSIGEQPAPVATVESQPVEKVKTPKFKKRHGEVTRKTRLAPNRSYEASVFFQGGEEIARHKVSRKGLVYDQEGKIPNGKVKFINETDQTYGVEYYRGGLRHGSARVNNKDGSLKAESTYQYGKLMTRKEYYSDGILGMEEDYTDAREYDDGREVGAGKVYYRDGMVQFEWYLTNSDPKGYHRSYDRKGGITGVIYFDKDGNEVESKAEITANNAVSGVGL